MTRRTTLASKNSSQGLSQQLSNLQIRCALKRKTLFNEGMCNKRNSTQKIVVKLPQQLVTEVYRPCTGYTALYTCFSNCLQSVVPTGYQPHSLVHSTSGYRVYRPGTSYTAFYSCFNNYRLHSLVQLLQQVVTVYRPGTGYTAM